MGGAPERREGNFPWLAGRVHLSTALTRAPAGEGLGRERQGISTPLIMQKTNARAGVIVNAEPQLPAGGPPDKKPRTGVQIVGKPSRVLCLRNMVGARPQRGGRSARQCAKPVATGCSLVSCVACAVRRWALARWTRSSRRRCVQVVGVLSGLVGTLHEERFVVLRRPQVGVECTKYGPVSNVMIFEVTQAGFQPEEAVRIFIEVSAAAAGGGAVAAAGRDLRCGEVKAARSPPTARVLAVRAARVGDEGVRRHAGACAEREVTRDLFAQRSTMCISAQALLALNWNARAGALLRGERGPRGLLPRGALRVHGAGAGAGRVRLRQDELAF